ncbi:MAG: hypothetical protein II724_08260 [Clostridia bacterium]|nr:hypothetical protein [Clostridia bacterium]
MKPFICPICGGKLNIRIGEAHAECDSCGRLHEIDAANVERLKKIYADGERAMRQNSAAGFASAAGLFRSIGFIDEAREKAELCEKRQRELNAERLQREEAKKLADKRNTRLGVVLLILTVLLCAAALAGIVYLIVRWVQGTLSKGTVITILAVVAAAVIISVLGKLLAGRGSDS